jgi:tetratricopeptide (TPR) repeat protein
MTKPIFHNKKLTALALVGAITVMSILCSHPNHTELLSHVDSLLVKNKSQQALNSLMDMDRSEFNKRDQAYYNLLLTQAKYKNHINATSDSGINDAVSYYSKSEDKEKHTSSLIYQGLVNEELGNYDKAVLCYHKAERTALKTDISNQAFAKLRLGYLYKSQFVGAKIIASNKFQEALKLYKQMGNQQFVILCLKEIGELYCDQKGKAESALHYINEALDLAKALPTEQYALFSTYTCRAQYYASVENDYTKAKNDALKAISSIDSNQIDNPRAHFTAALAYINLQQLDSCIHFLKYAPEMTCYADSILYFKVLSNINFHQADYPQAFSYYKKAMNLEDSALVNSLTHRLLTIEKRYDLQNEELQNEKLRSNLKNTWLALAVLAAIGLGLLSIALGYRSRLRNKEHEFELLRADLDSSTNSLEQVQATLSSYEEDMNQATSTITKLNQEIDAAHQRLIDMESERTHYQKNVESSRQSITLLNDQIAVVKNELVSKERERAELNDRLAELEHRKGQSDEIISILDGQIKVIHQLMQWAYELDGNAFTKKFNSIMTIQEKKNSSSYWSNLQSLVNDLYDNILVKAQEQAGGTLRDDELNFIALYCCGFSRTAIMVCMNYKHIVTISNKKVQIAKKLGINNLDKFVEPYQR